MVARIKVDTSDLERFARQFGEQGARQIKYATARALTALAKKGQKAIEQQIGGVFSNATPWIRKGVFVTAARTSGLEATVGIKDQGARATPAHYLREHITAGERGNKPMELAMRSMGILPAGWLAVPSRDGVQRDAYGNVSRATLSRILRALSQKQTTTRGAIAARVFVIKPGVRSHLAPGIWSATRVGDQRAIKPVFLFVSEVSYRRVLDLEEIVGDVVRRDLDAEFRAAFDEAMRTGR